MGIKQHLSVMKNLSFVLYGFMLFTIPSANTATFTFLPGLATEKGVSCIQAATLISVIGAARAVGTLAIGFMFDTELVRRHRRMFHSVIGMLLGISQLAIATAHSFIVMAAMACWYGFMLARVMEQRATALSEYVTKQQLPYALGFMTMFLGLTLQGIILMDLLLEACMYVCVYVCMYVYIYIYIYRHILGIQM